MDLKELVSQIRSYPGVTRKSAISDIVGFFPISMEDNVIASFGEDAAVIDYGEYALLLAADGIMEDLMEKNGFWAGYCSVLVNVNDIAAMGGIPLAMVNVISMRKGEDLNSVLEGMREAIKKFGVAVVGGHTHPDCNYNAIDVAILGHAKKDDVVFSHTSEIGDDIIFSMDTDGTFTPNIPYSWDSTSTKKPELVQKQIRVMNEMAGKGLLTGGKDISNPGCLGTLAMLLETSKKGGVVRLESIPRPENVDLVQWLKAYQGCGFVVTCRPNNSHEVLRMYKNVGLSADIAGSITEDRLLKITKGNAQEILFDLKKDKITGCEK